MSERKFKFWGWGYTDEGATAEERQRLRALYARRFGVSRWEEVPPPAASEIALPAARLRPPAAAAALFSSETEDRL
ncbi:MAG TPA: hypothetical protein VFB20_08170, partial [Burkholderiales bacterium]|nr:hypothetical protein [Burkholderiales bacterium]